MKTKLQRIGKTQVEKYNNGGIIIVGGRGASSSGGGGGGGGGSIGQFQMLNQAPNIVATQQIAQQANARTFDDTDSRPYHDLLGGKNYFQSQNLTIDEQIATVNYLSDTKESGTQYSMSQNMNQALATGKKLTANQQYVYDHMMSSMHNLGENLNLSRYDHDTFANALLKQVGISTSYDKMSMSQLKKALVGTTYKENRLLSTSTNDFVNAPQKTKDVFLTRPVKISYKAKANVQGMMPGNGPGGKIGEMVLAPSGKKDNFKIIDVKSTGKKARVKGTQSYSLPQIEFVVEVDKQD